MCCNTLQHTATGYHGGNHLYDTGDVYQDTHTTNCNTLQRAATHCNTLQRPATRNVVKSADPMNDSKIYKGQPRRLVLGELVPNQYKSSNWYKSFPPDHSDQAEINKSTNQQIN